MGAEEYLKNGDLEQALTSLTDEIRNHPSKAELRIFLFQLLSVLGQWDRAITQLNVAADMDSDAMLMAQVYRIALNSEVLRSDVFKGSRSPLILGEPLDWLVWLTQVPSLLAGGNPGAAADLRDRAFEAAPTMSGTINGEAFSWIADADSRLGPTLEAIVNGNYYWIPFQRIQALRIEKPVSLRDVVWIPATFVWDNEGEAAGLIPSRYSGSENSEESSFKMGRRTDWQDAGNGFFLGMGQRMLATDQGEYPLFEVREVILNPVDTSS